MSVRHRGLERLIEDNQPKGLRPDLVSRVRNILTVLVLAERLRFGGLLLMTQKGIELGMKPSHPGPSSGLRSSTSWD
ncbi:MAG: hypothetical protein OJF51_000437 [Nitrospira sp.]|jgi:hypothetical protein|nr:MAG: hypothetical protein OJF51_000437 [Nitrospira sp.]